MASTASNVLPFVADLFNALAPALAKGGASLIGKLAPSNPQVQQDAETVLNDLFKLVSDLLAANASATVAAASAAAIKAAAAQQIKIGG